MSRASNLYRLQQADSRLDAIQARMKAIRHTLENDENLQAALRTDEEARQAALLAERNAKQQDDEVETLRIKIEQVEASLYSGRIQNPKELKDLQAESESLKRHLQSLEEHLFESMIAAETAGETVRASQSNLVATQAQVISQNASLKGELDALEKELGRLQTDRQAIASGIEADLITDYLALREKRHGVAVSLIGEGSCNSCGSALTPSQQVAARSGNQIAHCPGCQRILYGN